MVEKEVKNKLTGQNYYPDRWGKEKAFCIQIKRPGSRQYNSGKKLPSFKFSFKAWKQGDKKPLHGKAMNISYWERFEKKKDECWSYEDTSNFTFISFICYRKVILINYRTFKIVALS